MSETNKVLTPFGNLHGDSLAAFVGRTVTIENSYGKFSVAVGSLPAEAVYSGIQRGFTHFLGSVTAADVVSQIRSILRESMGAEAYKAASKEALKSAITAWKAGNADKLKVMEQSAYEANVKAIMDGSIGTSEGGPRGPVDPIGQAALRLAELEVMGALGDQKVTQAKRAELAKEYFSLNEAHFRAEAERQLKRSAKTTNTALQALIAKAA